MMLVCTPAIRRGPALPTEPAPPPSATHPPPFYPLVHLPGAVIGEEWRDVFDIMLTRDNTPYVKPDKRSLLHFAEVGCRG